MRGCLILVLALTAMVSTIAPAQPVFFDDFDGDELLPHWNTSPDDHWEYEVSGGMLHVTDLLWPSDPHFGPNYAVMGAGYEPQTDFRADVWMGWEAGDSPQELALWVVGEQGHFIAEFGYSTLIDEPNPVIFAAASNEAVFEPAPPPGMHHFTITRVGAQFDFYLNGEPFATIPDRFGEAAAWVYLWFLGPYPGELGAFHIDRARVVPAPGVVALLAGLGLCIPYRRRARRTGCDHVITNQGGLR